MPNRWVLCRKFEARRVCDARHYEYLLPLSLLPPNIANTPGFDEKLARLLKMFEGSNRVRRIVLTLSL